MRRFEFVKGASKKFWEIELEGNRFKVRWGRIGAEGQTKEKRFASLASARTAHDKLVTEKLGKGYVEMMQRSPVRAKVANKKKTLPKNFEQLLEKGDLARLKAVFETCDVDARGGYGKQTALAFDECPDALSRWLVSEGADLSAVDAWGNTPLHSRIGGSSDIAVLLELGADVNAASASIGTPLHAAADERDARYAKQLLAHGAKVNARNNERMTPLEVALGGCTNAELELLPPFVRVMLDAGATRTPAMKRHVERLGETFEFHRTNFSRTGLPRADAALKFLYRTFDVVPVPPRPTHDPRARITVKTTTWQAQHDELWKLLVPSSGPAKTVQGEVIRITGRVSDEWCRNGGINWDRDYSAMARAFAGYLQQGRPLEPGEVTEVKAIVRSLSAKDGDGHERLAELAVAWVLKNSSPLGLKRPAYGR